MRESGEERNEIFLCAVFERGDFETLAGAGNEIM